MTAALARWVITRIEARRYRKYLKEAGYAP